MTDDPPVGRRIGRPFGRDEKHASLARNAEPLTCSARLIAREQLDQAPCARLDAPLEELVVTRPLLEAAAYVLASSVRGNRKNAQSLSQP